MSRPKAGEVDAVYLWVDSSNDSFVDSRNRLAKKYELNEYWSPTRDHGEIKASIKSVRKNMTWIRNIYVIVPKGHSIPDLDADKFGVIYITNEELLGEKNCPTFNSSALEVAQHNIQGLSEYFLTFNDDFFVVRNSPLSDFYDFEKNQLKYYYENYLLLGKPFSSTTSKIVNELVGEKYYFWAVHMPRMFRKSDMNRFCKQYREEVENTIQSRFRSSSDVQMVYLYGYYLLARSTGQFIFLNNQTPSSTGIKRIIIDLKRKILTEGLLQTVKQAYLQLVWKSTLFKNKIFSRENCYSLITVQNDIQKNKSLINKAFDMGVRYICLNDRYDRSQIEFKTLQKENYDYLYKHI